MSWPQQQRVTNYHMTYSETRCRFTVSNLSHYQPHQTLTICLSEKTERLWMSARLWVVLQLRQTAGSAMRPRSTSTRVLKAHTWHWKKASCISGMSCEVRITMPLIVISWSMSVEARHKAHRSFTPEADTSHFIKPRNNVHNNPTLNMGENMLETLVLISMISLCKYPVTWSHAPSGFRFLMFLVFRAL